MWRSKLQNEDIATENWGDCMKRQMAYLIWLLMATLHFVSSGSAEELKSPTFKVQMIKILKADHATVSLKIEVADNDERWQYGLMNRHSLPEGKGMLFVFPDEQVRQFWMKNTFVDLSIGYFDEKMILLNILDMTKVSSEMEKNLPVYSSRGPAKYALEVPKGWFVKHKIGPGDKLVLK